MKLSVLLWILLIHLMYLAKVIHLMEDYWSIAALILAVQLYYLLSEQRLQGSRAHTTSQTSASSYRTITLYAKSDEWTDTNWYLRKGRRNSNMAAGGKAKGNLSLLFSKASNWERRRSTKEHEASYSAIAIYHWIYLGDTLFSGTYTYCSGILLTRMQIISRSVCLRLQIAGISY